MNGQENLSLLYLHSDSTHSLTFDFAWRFFFPSLTLDSFVPETLISEKIFFFFKFEGNIFLAKSQLVFIGERRKANIQGQKVFEPTENI